MDPIYVTGHRNPDTDSIVAAISYAALRNACGDREYEAACLGRVSDETQIVLDRFGFLPPKRITDLYNQVRDLDFDKPPILSGGVTMGRAWDEFQAYPAIASIPVVNEDGTLYGILSRTDIADYNMSRTNSGVLEEVPLFNAISVLEGKILNDAGESTDTISGEVTIALPQSRENLLFHSRESIVLCGNQPDMIRRALELNVSCLVLCQAEISEELRTMPTETCIISTPYDAFRAARLIFQSIPVERICNTQNVVSFHLDDRVDTVRDVVLKYRHPSYPILDGNEKVVGILTRYHLLRPRRKQVVLVDHNEASQSVPGLEEAEILAIIDHHRLADIQTGNPIYVRNEPVGSTNTIIAEMYQDRGLMPSAKLAGMMAAAILSTPYDAFRAARLIFQSIPVERICNTQNVVSFHLDDRVDTVRDVVLKYRHPSYPILDGNEKVVGILTRYHLLRPRRKQVVLVDHNEASQSVPGLEEAEILAIIDHHRLADIQTGNPIYVRNEPVGSTNTIIAEMYQDRGLMPSAKLAGMMAAAILSDTVMFKSPTCTPRDIRTAERMARIADVSLDELGHEIFSAAVENKSVEEVFFTDYKEFHIAGHSLAVSQLTCVDSPSVLKRKDEFLKLMKKTADEKMFDLVIMMLTDVLLEGTQIIYVGDDDTIRQAFNVIPKDNTVFLPKVMSRKKQIIPMLSVLWG